MTINDSTSSTPAIAKSIDWGRYALVGLGTIVAAIVANVLVYSIGRAIVGYDPEFIVLADVSPAILFTVVPAIVAVVLYALLMRFTSDPARIFTIIAAVVLVLSLIPDFTYIPTVPGASTGQAVVLAIMHIVAAVVIVGMLTSFSRRSTR